MLDLHTVFEAVGSVGLLTAAGYLWRASARFTTMANDIKELKDNHLPHLSEEVREVSQKLDSHIQWHLERK